jgi:hypothetical protein
LGCILEITNLVYDLQVLTLDPILRNRRVTEVERQLRLDQQIGDRITVEQEGGRHDEIPVVVRLYKMAALIYLERIRYETSCEPQSTFDANAVADGLALLACADVREVLWPLFVIGCEAATDAQRRRVLQFLDAESLGIHLLTPRRLITAFWIQDDLDVIRELSYVKKMSGIICTLPYLPSFA